MLAVRWWWEGGWQRREERRKEKDDWVAGTGSVEHEEDGHWTVRQWERRTWDLWGGTEGQDKGYVAG